MGLDMFEFAVPRPLATAAVDFKASETDGFQQLHYWRKHPNLHGWMEALYRSKGGQSEPFNCTTVELTASDLIDLEAAVRNRLLPETSGFFFGETDGSEIEDDLVFIAKAHDAIRDGMAVYYDCWW